MAVLNPTNVRAAHAISNNGIQLVPEVSTSGNGVSTLSTCRNADSTNIIIQDFCHRTDFCQRPTAHDDSTTAWLKSELNKYAGQGRAAATGTTKPGRAAATRIFMKDPEFGSPEPERGQVFVSPNPELAQVFGSPRPNTTRKQGRATATGTPAREFNSRPPGIELAASLDGGLRSGLGRSLGIKGVEANASTPQKTIVYRKQGEDWHKYAARALGGSLEAPPTQFSETSYFSWGFPTKPFFRCPTTDEKLASSSWVSEHLSWVDGPPQSQPPVPAVMESVALRPPQAGS